MTGSALLPRVGAGVAVVALGLVLGTTSATAQDPPNSDFDVEFRDLLVVDANGDALDGGGGTTAFAIELEGEPQCPGDSTHDDYRVDSYMVPLDTDASQLDFNGFGPNPPRFREHAGFQMPLIPLSGNGFAAELTGDAFEVGGPGPIRDLPAFDFASYVPSSSVTDWDGGVPPGSYRVGLACTFAGRMTNAWETTMDVTADPADEPIGMRWTITGPQPRALETAESTGERTIALALLGFAALAAAVAFLLHRSSRPEVEGARSLLSSNEPVP